jgi:hypothetical protein
MSLLRGLDKMPWSASLVAHASLAFESHSLLHAAISQIKQRKKSIITVPESRGTRSRGNYLLHGNRYSRKLKNRYKVLHNGIATETLVSVFAHTIEVEQLPYFLLLESALSAASSAPPYFVHSSVCGSCAICASKYCKK